MTADQDPPKGAWEGLPTALPSTTVPPWAVPALIIGVACSLVVGWISFDYFAGQASGDPPSVAFAYMLPEIPLLLIGVPSMLFGALGIARPRTATRPILRIAIIVGVMAWWYAVLEGAGLLV